MNETNFDPTFADEKLNYNDLSEAHDSDVNDGGNQEEGVYPTQNVHVDNAGFFGNQLRNAQTPEDLVKASVPLTNLNPETGVSELEERTGQHHEVVDAFKQEVEARRRQIESWEQRKDEELGFINNSADMDQLERNLGFINTAFNAGTLGEKQVGELRAAGEAKRQALQVATAISG